MLRLPQLETVDQTVDFMAAMENADALRELFAAINKVQRIGARLGWDSQSVRLFTDVYLHRHDDPDLLPEDRSLRRRNVER